MTRRAFEVRLPLIPLWLSVSAAIIVRALWIAIAATRRGTDAFLVPDSGGYLELGYILLTRREFANSFRTPEIARLSRLPLVVVMSAAAVIAPSVLLRRTPTLGRPAVVSTLHGIVFLLVCAALVTPWHLRNYQRTQYAGFSTVMERAAYIAASGSVIARRDGVPQVPWAVFAGGPRCHGTTGSRGSRARVSARLLAVGLCGPAADAARRAARDRGHTIVTRKPGCVRGPCDGRGLPRRQWRGHARGQPLPRAGRPLPRADERVLVQSSALTLP